MVVNGLIGLIGILTGSCIFLISQVNKEHKRAVKAEKQSELWHELHDSLRARLTVKDNVIAAKNGEIMKLATQIRQMSERR